MKRTLHILGGGPAGLATAYYANRCGWDTHIFEAGHEAGGNCRTLSLGSCLYDTGAHRLHLRNPNATEAFHDLLGDRLLHVDAPSAVATQGKLLRFPPSPSDLIRQLGLGTLGHAALELGWNWARRGATRLNPFDPPGTLKSPNLSNFGSIAQSLYGKTLANLFLLNYTRKLWGRDPFFLSSQVGGGRLQGLNALALFKEKIGAGKASAHLDGDFLYPKLGIGSLFEALVQRLDPGALHLNSAVTGIRHDGKRILGVTVNGRAEEATPHLVSSLPLPVFLRALQPAPPSEILAAVEGMAFRQLLLAVCVLDMERFTDKASLYFPDPGIPFTRVYEPKNRSPHMAPPHLTCLVLEIPCDATDLMWQKGETDSAELLRHLNTVKPVDDSQLLHTDFVRIPNAYPVLEIGIEKRMEALLGYCRRFENLSMVGRNARFEYLHIHDLFAQGAEVVTSLQARGLGQSRP
jgi:protoporphyrinogen oxidase